MNLAGLYNEMELTGYLMRALIKPRISLNPNSKGVNYIDPLFYPPKRKLRSQ